MTNSNNRPITFGVIVGNRGFFPDHLARTGREEMLAALQTAGYGVVAVGPEETKYGAVETRAVAPGFPFSTTRAQMSKLPLSLALQNTQGRPLPSTAMAGRHRSPPGAVIAIGSLEPSPVSFRSRI